MVQDTRITEKVRTFASRRGRSGPGSLDRLHERENPPRGRMEISMVQDAPMTERVRVVAIGPGHLSLEPLGRSDCSLCAGGCRSGRLFRIFSSRRRIFSLPVSAPDDYRVGDRLTLSLSPRALVTACALAYMGPLALLLGLSLIGYSLGFSELMTAAFAAGGFVLVHLSRQLGLLKGWRPLGPRKDVTIERN